MATKPLPVTPENFAFKVLNALMVRMFAPELRRLQTGIDRIIDQQEEIESSGGKLSFMYGGVVYRSSRAPAAFAKNPMLHHSLWTVMDDHLKDVETVARDRDLVQQALFKCVQGWTDWQDFRNRLPECVVPIIDWAEKPQRSVPFEEATCLKDRDQRQFQKILPKIEMYAMAKLIY